MISNLTSKQTNINGSSCLDLNMNMDMNMNMNLDTNLNLNCLDCMNRSQNIYVLNVIWNRNDDAID